MVEKMYFRSRNHQINNSKKSMNNILNQLEIEQKINRLAHELLENCFEEKEIFIAGISGNGSLLAEKLSSILKLNTSQEVHVFELSVNKDEPWSEPIKLSIPEEQLNHAFIILVDDVLNSGKTMQYALVKLLERPTKAIKTLALVDRSHRRYPIKADFVGLSLSTTLKERVEVDLSSNNAHAYLI
jgi:pyrimidine operon attenuation protein/uracil phosphoribosyltransferase